MNQTLSGKTMVSKLFLTVHILIFFKRTWDLLKEISMAIDSKNFPMKMEGTVLNLISCITNMPTPPP